MHQHRYLTIEQRESLEQIMRSQPSLAGSLQRLHTPDYGVCEDCGQDIPFVRLKAFPNAVRCAACEARR
jgi:RNA polymerase-binding transcription factor DksA